MDEQKIKNISFYDVFFTIIILITLFVIANETIKQIILDSLFVALIYLAFVTNLILQLKDYERAVYI
jgi:uncharacterized membrane protein